MRDEIYVGALISERAFLSHHGIMGQKWGVRHGPPYPLSDNVANKVNKKSERTKYGFDPASIYVALSVGLFAYTAVDAAAVRHKEHKYLDTLNAKREKAGERIDKSTGFYLKKGKTSAEEDAKKVNPRYGDEGWRFSQNCMLCTTAYDLRRRGYDVEACFKTWKNYGADAVKKWYPEAKVERYYPDHLKNGKNARNIYYDSVKKSMLSQGDGARGNLMVRWKNAEGGHSVAYEVSHGKIRIFDTQTGRVYDNPDVLLSRTEMAHLARLDNIEFNPKKIKECCR